MFFFLLRFSVCVNSVEKEMPKKKNCKEIMRGNNVEWRFVGQICSTRSNEEVKYSFNLIKLKCLYSFLMQWFRFNGLFLGLNWRNRITSNYKFDELSIGGNDNSKGN